MSALPRHIRLQAAAREIAAVNAPKTENCPTCGRWVASIFDHLDEECQDWPDDDIAVAVRFRVPLEAARHCAAYDHR